MNTKNEIQKTILLEILGNAYKTGDFNSLFEHLSQDIIWESEWVKEPRIGYDVVTKYYIDKGKIMKGSNSLPNYTLIRLIGNLNIVDNMKLTVNGKEEIASYGMYYEDKELCLLLSQKIDNNVNNTILRIEINEDNKIKRIDLCNPMFFKYEKVNRDC